MTKNEPAVFEQEYLYEANRDVDGRFFAVHYMSDGLSPQFHACMEVFAVVKGTVHATVNNNRYEVSDGQILLINSFELHSYKIDGQAEVACLLLGNECVGDFTAEYRNYEFSTEFRDEKLSREIIDLIIDIEKQQETFGLLEQKGYADLVLGKIVRGGGIRPQNWATNVKLANIIKFIYDNSEKEITLKNIADAFNYAPLSVSHMFSKYVGTDLRCFVNDIRIQKAHRMIHDEKFSGVSVLEIAFDCGFNSAATFYRAYKRRYGITPRR